MTNPPQVVAVLACHDRREATLAALAALAGQTGHGADLRVVLVDDGSSDGTAAAVRARFPDTTIERGDGSLWWNGGMRHGMAVARREHDPDHLLWLNDDTVLDPDALGRLLATRDGLPGPAIVVGTTRDPDTGELTYGGVRRPDRRRPMSFELVPPDPDRARPAETMNGNVVLVPRPVFEIVGELDPVFTHAMGDYDYGLRARAADFEVVVAPGTFGTCARNPDPWATGDVEETWRRLRGPRGLPPAEWREFTRRWAGPLWPVYFASPYVRRLLRAARREV